MQEGWVLVNLIKLIAQLISGIVGFAALAVFLVIGLNIYESGQWVPLEIGVVAVAGIIALVSLRILSRL